MLSKFVSIIMAGTLMMFAAVPGFTEEVGALKKAFKGGKFSGIIGNYYEFKVKEADDSNAGWSTGYLTVKYETLSWNNLKFGVRFFAHGQLYSAHDDGITDPFDGDIESQYTLPEAYLNYSFAESSSITVGRWTHKKITHIDDAQSEGGYIRFKEIENFELIAGVMTRFAEIDYDDGEDFGRSNDAQDLDSEDTYGEGSSAYLFFLEGKYFPIDLVKFNPYFMYHDNYASVLGIDTTIASEWNDYEIKYGSLFAYVHINAEISGSGDADVFAIMPFVQKGPVKLNFSYSKFDDGNALNHPDWLVDNYKLVDQNVAENNAGAEVFEFKIKYSILEDLWASFIYADANYDASSSEGDGYVDYEFQVGYKITDNLDINVRYFIVSFNNIDDKDYKKIESRVRFKF